MTSAYNIALSVVAAFFVVYLLAVWMIRSNLMDKLDRFQRWMLEVDRQIQINAKKDENRGLSRWGAWRVIFRVMRSTKL